MSCAIIHLPSQQIANLLVNATALNLAPGWHSLQVDMQQRSTVAETFGQPRRSTWCSCSCTRIKV